MKITKEYLEETRKMHVDLQWMEEEIQIVKNKATSAQAFLFSERVQSSRKADPMADKVTAYAVLEDRYMDLFNEYLNRCAIVSSGIKGLPVREQAIILGFYLDAESMRYISEKMYLSERTAYRLRQNALTHIAQMG